MVIFINDKLVRVVSAKKIKYSHYNDFDTRIDSCLETLNLKKIQGNALILNATETTINKFFKLIQRSKNNIYESVTFVVEDKLAAETQIKSFFKVVKAAGGVVFNKENKILMMYRLGKWDLPKGKRDNNEKAKQTAVREVGEECGIEVALGEKICTTWHTYTMGTRKILKRTKWYKMICTDESKIQPQTEEGIEKLQWMSKKECQSALLNSYSSIKFVIEQLK